MDLSGKANREDQEKTLQYQSEPVKRLVDELNDTNLAHLLEFVANFEQTPTEATELKRRITLFGDCKRMEDETSGEFYARLRHWLDRSLTRRSPLHEPRQTGG